MRIATITIGAIGVDEVVNVEALAPHGVIHVGRVSGSAVLRIDNGAIHETPPRATSRLTPPTALSGSTVDGFLPSPRFPLIGETGGTVTLRLRCTP